MPGDDPDYDLVKALQAGDDSALDELIARHQKPLMAMLFRNLGSETVAQDLLQEAFVRAYFNIGKFEPRAKFATWLWSIAINLCRDYAKSKAHQNELRTQSLTAFEGLERLQAGTNHPDRAVALKEISAALRAAIARLPDRLREPLILFAVEGLPQEECAKILKISAKAVEARVYRARKILYKDLQNFS
jgi:RNA polymerase sigma-70 factor (ECF subfamily)